MSKASIDPTVRQQQDILYAELKEMREQIAARINEEYHDRTSNLRAALDGLEYQRKQFTEAAKAVLREIPVGATIIAVTQNGRGATNVVKHVGTLESKSPDIGLFNMVDVPSQFDGKPFTIALNCCLVSIEKA